MLGPNSGIFQLCIRRNAQDLNGSDLFVFRQHATIRDLQNPSIGGWPGLLGSVETKELQIDEDRTVG